MKVDLTSQSNMNVEKGGVGQERREANTLESYIAKRGKFIDKHS